MSTKVEVWTHMVQEQNFEPRQLGMARISKSGLYRREYLEGYCGRPLPSLSAEEPFSSVAQSCLTLCDPMDCSTPGFPVHHQLLEPAQTHLHWVDDATQRSSSLSLLLLLPSIFPRISVFSKESVLHIRWPKYWSFSFSISSSNEYSGLITFRIDWLDFFVVQRTLKSLFQYHSPKASVLQNSISL